jgi:predicted  nucleic acid-binding Zn-ribbon protein
MGPASDDQTEKPATFPLLDHYTALTMDVRWLQEKFDELLKQQQNILLTLSEVLTRVDGFEKQVATLEKRLRAIETRHAKY